MIHWRLLEQDCQDNISKPNLRILHDFSEDFKRISLDSISNLSARNLIAQMLTKEVSRRPGISQVLSHPFFTGRSSARLMYEEPEFDVFISYRVASDAHHAELLFKLLSAAEIKVWYAIQFNASTFYHVILDYYLILGGTKFDWSLASLGKMASVMGC